MPWNPNVHASVWPEYLYAAGRYGYWRYFVLNLGSSIQLLWIFFWSTPIFIAVACFSFHTIVSHWTQIKDPKKSHLQEPESWYNIHEHLGKSYVLTYSKNKGNELLANALYDPEQCYDSSFVPEMRGTYPGAPKGSLDMLARNFHRYRAAGGPWYTELRDWCGESPIYDWSQAKGIWNDHCMNTLPQVYG